MKIGYARTSTDDQTLPLQLAVLKMMKPRKHSKKSRGLHQHIAYMNH